MATLSPLTAQDERMRDALGERLFEASRAVLDVYCVHIGDRLGLYRALADGGALTADELAAAAGIHPRYAREWLNAQSAAGYLTYHRASETYELTPEHAQVLADEDSACFVPPAWNMPAAM